jgi:hypothetical protein
MKALRALRTLAVVVGACALLVGCAPDRTTEVASSISCAGCLDYDAVSPGATFDIRVAWTARCTDEGPVPDTSTTYTCNEQPFFARVLCNGAACGVTPGSASSDGARFTGEGELGVVLSEEGDLELTVELEHAGTGEVSSQSFSFTVREPARLVIDCWWNFDPLARTCTDEGSYKWCETPTWSPCEGTLMLEPEHANPLSIWVYGEAEGVPIRLMPEASVSFEGFMTDGYAGSDGAPHDDPSALLEADRYSAELTTPGQYGVSASFGVLSSSLSMDAQ